MAFWLLSSLEAVLAASSLPRTVFSRRLASRVSTSHTTAHMGQAKNIQGALRNICARLSVLRFLTTASTISSASMPHRYQMRTRKAGIRAWPSTVSARSSSRSWLLLSRSEVFWTSSSVSQPLIRSLLLFSVMSTQKRGVISILLSLFQLVQGQAEAGQKFL